MCRAWARPCPLEGRGDVQGRRADGDRLPLPHVEFARSVRVSDAGLRRAVAAVNTVTARWAEG